MVSRVFHKIPVDRRLAQILSDHDDGFPAAVSNLQLLLIGNGVDLQPFPFIELHKSLDSVYGSAGRIPEYLVNGITNFRFGHSYIKIEQ